jgi:AraC family transcriptional regulator
VYKRQAFNRAFQSVHGIAPSAVRNDGVSVKSFPPLTFRIAVSGGAELNYRVKRKEAFRIIGVSKPLDSEIENNFAVVPALWQEAAMNGTVERLAEMTDTAPMGILGVSVCNDEEQWKYFLAAASTKKAEGFEEYMVPAFTWAVFPGEGACPGAIQELERRIVTEWLPTSGYEYDNGPDIEVYLNPDPSDAKFEVWIPVKPKNTP